MDWLILIFLIPLVLIPVVFLTGFAGCSFEIRPAPPTELPEAPSGLEATAVRSDQIDLTWKDGAPMVTTKFRIDRWENGAQISSLTPAPSGVVDQKLSDKEREAGMPLKENTTYKYQVFAIVGDDTNVSADSIEDSATTLFKAYGTALTNDDPTWAANTPFTIVQLIPSANLTRDGSKVRITLRSAAAGQLVINNVFISQVASAGNVWDSAPDLTEVKFETSSGVTIPAGEYKIMDETSYPLMKAKVLLIAFNISNTNGSLRRAPLPTASMHSKQGLPFEAQQADRSPGYTTRTNQVYIVEQIDVLP